MESPTIKNSFPYESVPGNSHTTSIHGEKYDVYRLIRAAETAPLSERPLSPLFVQAVKIPGWRDSSEQRISMRDVLKAILHTSTKTLDWEGAMQAHPHLADHISRIRDADCRHPILLAPNGNILDGMHRIAKGFLERMDTLPVRQFSSIPESAKF